MPSNSTFFSLLFLHREIVNLRKSAAFGRVVSSAPWARIWGLSSLLTQKSLTNRHRVSNKLSDVFIDDPSWRRLRRRVGSMLIKLSNLVNNVCLCNAILNVESVISSVWSKQIPGWECGAYDPFLRILHLNFQRHDRLSTAWVQVTHVIHRTSCTAWLAKPDCDLHQ